MLTCGNYVNGFVSRSPLLFSSHAHSVSLSPSASAAASSLPESLRKENRLKMDGQESEDQKQSTADMTAFVQNLLLQMQSRFQAMSESIVSKIDEMGARIDELEQSINDLKTEMGAESSSPLAPTKGKSEESRPADC